MSIRSPKALGIVRQEFLPSSPKPHHMEVGQDGGNTPCR